MPPPPSLGELKSCGNGKQSVEGVLKIFQFNGPVLVCSEGWPSWSFAMRNLGCSTICTMPQVGPFFNSHSKKEFLNSSLGSTCVDSYKELVNFCIGKGPPLIFIQGSHKFSEQVKSNLAMLKQSTILEVLPPPVSFKDGSLNESAAVDLISHADAGGITDGVWMYRSNSFIDPNHFDRDVSRNLGSTLRPTVKGGKLLSKMKEQDLQGVLRGHDLIPTRQRDMRVVARDVFQKNKLVVRPIDFCELAEAYDLDIATQKSMALLEKESNLASSRGFVGSAPIKVLMRLGRVLLNSVIGEGVDALHPTSNTTKRKRADAIGMDSLETLDVKTRVNSLTPLKRVTTELNREPVGDAVLNTSGLKVLDWIPEKLGDEFSTRKNDEDVNKPSVKAAKNDDAKVDESSWDRWAVNSFACKGDTPPLVCRANSYGPSHARLFRGLRVLMHRRYRLNVTRSLLKHMHKSHGTVDARDRCDAVRLTDPASGTTTNRTFKTSRWLDTLGQQDKAFDGPSRLPQVVALKNFYKDRRVGKDALTKAAWSTWWTWDIGSTLFFWRWPPSQRMSARDGMKLYIQVGKNRMPRYQKKQKVTDDPNARAKVTAKLNNVRWKNYIAQGHVKSLTNCFDVPKGEGDIRMVYDATKSGLNDVLWTPNFFLPTIDSILRNADKDFWFGDIDLGEMFLNFWLDEELRPYAGVDVTEMGKRFFNKQSGQLEFVHEKIIARLWERWERTLMGLQSSPYVCTKAFSWCEDFIRGNRLDAGNPLQWRWVVLNLPGSEDYNPAKPWVYRICESGDMASFFGTYIDDIRTGGTTESNTHSVARRVASRLQYYGIQDAARKRRNPSRTPGAWAGALCSTQEKTGLFVSCSQEKWDKGKKIITDIELQMNQGKNAKLDYKMLEKGVGFLVYLSRTYPAIFPYLKGIYHTMNIWRGGRDQDGWKIPDAELEELLQLEEDIDGDSGSLSKAPSKVDASGRLEGDVQALKTLFGNRTPPNRLVRGKGVRTVRYGFGDASKAGFGSSWESKDGIRYRYGVWDESLSEGSSNLRELTNLVETFEAMSEKEELEGNEVFLFTDNSTAEAAYFRGSSKSKLLFDLVLRLRKLEMYQKCKFHLVHVSGKRMIAQGSDGLSRGDFTEGVMRGDAMTSFIPLNETALERSPDLRRWVESWTCGDDLEWLNPEEWFTRGHNLVEVGEEGPERNVDGMAIPTYKSGKFVWTPAPAAAEACLEEIRKARHKHTNSTHLIMIPRLLSPYWRKHLCKVCDIIFLIPPGHPVWSVDMYEPLTVGIVFPFLDHRPWELRGTNYILGMHRHLQGVLKDNNSSDGPILQQLWELPKRLGNLSAELARKMLQGFGETEVSGRSTRRRQRGRNNLENVKSGRKVPKRKKR